MLVQEEGNSGWKGGARLCQEPFAPPGLCVPPVLVAPGGQGLELSPWLELSPRLSPPLPSTHLLLGAGEDTKPEMTLSNVFAEHPGAVYAFNMFVSVRKPIPDSGILTPAPPACPALLLAFPMCCSVGSKDCGGSASAVSPDERCFGTKYYSQICSRKPFNPAWAAHSSTPVIWCVTSLTCF